MGRQAVTSSIRIARRATIIAALLATAGCTPRGDSPEVQHVGQTAGAQRPADDPSQRVFASPDAAARLAAYLEHFVLTSPEPLPDSLRACYAPTDSNLGLAKYTVLSATPRGDTVDAAAEVLTVAEEHLDPVNLEVLLATLRIRRDTLHWTMARNDSTGILGVCGNSREGYGFVWRGFDVPGGTGRRWTPPGASWARARALVDSIRRQR